MAAEQIVQGARGPVAILRLATVVGSQSDGSLRRVGAFHNVLRWVYRGLLPLIPGETQTRVDLIPTEYVTEGVNRLLDAPLPWSPAFYHFSRGESAIPLGELIDLCALRFSRESEAWKRGQFEAPVLASIPAFEEFRRSVAASRDLLFTKFSNPSTASFRSSFFPNNFRPTRPPRSLAVACRSRTGKNGWSAFLISPFAPISAAIHELATHAQSLWYPRGIREGPARLYQYPASDRSSEGSRSRAIRALDSLVRSRRNRQPQHHSHRQLPGSGDGSTLPLQDINMKNFRTVEKIADLFWLRKNHDLVPTF